MFSAGCTETGRQNYRSQTLAAFGENPLDIEQRRNLLIDHRQAVVARARSSRKILATPVTSTSCPCAEAGMSREQSMRRWSNFIEMEIPGRSQVR